jgi:hypothetical protein
MPLDHYISQVHLKNFYSPELGELFYVIRKDNLKEFPSNSQSVCRIENGSTNAYLLDDRVLEGFLKTIEPKYNESLNKLETGNIDKKCVYTIAGFVAFVVTCSPTGMRILSAPLRDIVEIASEIIDKNGRLPKPPPELGGENLTELIKNGTINISIDEKYPQAIGINQILSFTSMFGNFKWEILHNKTTDSPFFTSDYPIALEKTKDPSIHNKIIPLSPTLAIRICPDRHSEKEKIDLNFSRFNWRRRTLNREEVVKINRLLVQCAESMIFYRDNHDWIHKFIAKNSKFRIEMHSTKIKRGNKIGSENTQRIVKTE